MKKVRKGIFETNSSSSHSIHIDNNMELMDTSLIPDEDGVIRINGGSYGWEWDKLISAYDKSCYCYVDNIDNNMLERVIKKQTGAKKVKFAKLNSDDYIDSSSSYTTKVAFNSDESLTNLIFNPKSIIYMGNDNSEAPIHFYCDKSNGKYKITLVKSDILRDMSISSILSEEFTSDLNDDDFNWVYSFGKSDENISDAIDEFMQHYNDYGMRYNKGEYIENNTDIEKLTIHLKTYNRKSSTVTNEEVLTIIVKENI